MRHLSQVAMMVKCYSCGEEIVGKEYTETIHALVGYTAASQTITYCKYCYETKKEQTPQYTMVLGALSVVIVLAVIITLMFLVL